ncbi:calpastatin isoform X27 [Salvelinus alpinus]|uniref:calpastatin isoform X27 n=1 Tax=Salvelinus alpinus TaxID=8036 RepID=UPI0039FC6423
MGQLLSWIRATRDNQALQDVAVEQQPAFDCCQCFKKAPKGYQELPSESFPPELFHPSSQPRQYSPTSVAQVAVNPAQFESASAASTMATKPGAVSVTMGGATASGATAGGSPTTAGTTQRGTAKVAMPETVLVSPAGATIIDIPTPGTKGSPKDTPKPAPMHPAKATPPTTGGGNIVGEATTPWKAEVPKLQESLKQTAKSVPTTSSKVDMAKKDPAKLVTAVAAPAAAAVDASLKWPQTKVQVEVVPPGAKAAKEELAVDPFDALADSLPSSESFAPAAHVYTGPEVIEHGLTSKKGVICGGKDCPLPPGYRFEDMAPVADVKPKDVPKPMSTDEALDSLSFGFTTSMAPIPQKQEKKVEDLGAIDALSAGFSNFAPPPPAPIKKSEEFKSAPVTKSPAPPVDKKAKVEKKVEDFASVDALSAGFSNFAPPPPAPIKKSEEFKSAPVTKSPAPPVDKTAKVEKFADDFSLMSGLDSPLDTKPKTDETVPTTSIKVDMAKKDPAQLVTAVAAPASAAVDASLKGPQTKVQVEVVPPGAMAAKEPAPMHPAKATPPTTGGGNIVGEATTPWKAEVPKLQESLKQTAKTVPTTSSKVDMAKKDPAKLVTAVAAPAAAAVDASLKGPQTKKSEEFKSAPVTKSPAPPVDKKAKVEKFADDFSLMSGLDSPLDTKPKTDETVPTTSIKVDMAKKDPAQLVTAVAAPASAAVDASLKGPQTKVQVEVVPPGAMAAKEPAPMHPAKATPPTTGGGNIVGEATTPWKAEVPKLQESLKQTAKTVPTTSIKVDMAKKDPAQLVTAVSAPASAAVDASLKGPQTKVQVEVVPPGAMAAKEPAPMHPAKATPPTTGGGNIVGEATTPWKAEVPKLQESLKQTAKSVPTTSIKVDMAKKDPAQLVTAVAAAAGDASLKGPQTKKSEEFKSAPVTKSPAPPVDKTAKVEKFADDFSLMSGLDSPLDTKPKTDEGGSMSLDALSALGDSLPALEPAPEPPKIRHEDIVTEGKLTSKKGVFVGERDDTLPPKYRLTENKVKDLPPLKPEPSMDSGEALEILSGDFMSSCVAPAVQAPVLCPPAPPRQASDDFALDALAGDFVAPAVAPAVKSAVDRQLSRGTVDALDTLSDSLMDKTPIPEPAPVSVRDIVKEKKIMEEKLTKVGERDDSLPAEYRPTEKDRKAMAEAKVQADVRPKQPSMDDSEALDLLSRDLSFSAGPAAASVAVTTEQRQPRLEPMSAPVLDDLAGTLLPDTPEFKSKGDKPKSKSKSRSKSKKQREEDPSSIDHLSGQLSSDVVSASTNKGGKS